MSEALDEPIMVFGSSVKSTLWKRLYKKRQRRLKQDLFAFAGIKA
jgi:hypothetical protein